MAASGRSTHGSEARHRGGGFVQISLMWLRNTDGTQSASPVFSFTKGGNGSKGGDKDERLGQFSARSLREALLLTSIYFS